MQAELLLDNGVSLVIKQTGDEVIIEFLGSLVNILELTKEVGDRMRTTIVVDATSTP